MVAICVVFVAAAAVGAQRQGRDHLAAELLARGGVERHRRRGDNRGEIRPERQRGEAQPQHPAKAPEPARAADVVGQVDRPAAGVEMAAQRAGALQQDADARGQEIGPGQAQLRLR